MRNRIAAWLIMGLWSVGAVSADRETIWKEMLAKPSLAIAAAFDDNGRLWLVNYRDRHLHLLHSDDLAKTMSAPVKINAEPEHMLGDGENRPKLVVRGNNLYVSYTSGLAAPMTGDIRFSRSVDGGRTFSRPISINDNREIISHRFEALVADAHGRVALAWLDKRDIETARRNGETYKGAAVYVAESVDGGQTFAPNRKLADHSCECCRVGLATDRDGMPVAFWRHLFDGGIRDFALARFDEPARRATEDDWKIDACPHHGGDLSIDRRGGRHLAWFTGAEKNPGVYYRRIDGEHMTPPIQVGNPDAQPGHPAVLAREEKVFLAWQEFDGKEMSIKVMLSRDRGDHWTQPASRAATQGAADYPVLIAGRGKAWLAWNTANEGFRLLDLEAVP